MNDLERSGVAQDSGTILIIDADLNSRNFLSTLLGKDGWRVVAADSAREGLIAAWTEQPQVILFDPLQADMDGLELLHHLRQDARTAHVPCVAFASRENQQESAALLGAGCADYLVKSRGGLEQLEQILPGLLNQQAAQPVRPAAVVTFLSAKGGTGTSTLCSNVASCLANARQDLRVLVMDLVLPVGSIADIVGYHETLNLVTIARLLPEQLNPGYLKANLPHLSGWNFSLLAGCPDPESASHLDASSVDRILRQVITLYDYVFIDIGHSLSRISLPIMQHSDVLALIVGADMATATLTRTVWEYLKSKKVDTSRLYVIQNRSVGLDGLSKAETEKMTDLSIRVTVPYTGEEFSLANNRHEPIMEKLIGDSTSLALGQIAREVVEAVQKLGYR
jgi:Flp pilus assembly CpaE family ATPase